MKTLRHAAYRTRERYSWSCEQPRVISRHALARNRAASCMYTDNRQLIIDREPTPLRTLIIETQLQHAVSRFLSLPVAIRVAVAPLFSSLSRERRWLAIFFFSLELGVDESGKFCRFNSEVDTRNSEIFIYLFVYRLWGFLCVCGEIASQNMRKCVKYIESVEVISWKLDVKRAYGIWMLLGRC